MRGYTIRAHHPSGMMIDIDFALAHRLTQDDAPAPEDLADAQEILSTLP